jgi:hypothetical protein
VAVRSRRLLVRLGKLIPLLCVDRSVQPRADLHGARAEGVFGAFCLTPHSSNDYQ